MQRAQPNAQNHETQDAKGRRSLTFGLFSIATGISVGALIVLLLVDMAASGVSLASDDEGLINALGSMAEVLTAVLGLTITVVAIVLQLASQRYSPKIVDLFMRDRVNAMMFGFMVSSCIYTMLLPAFAGTSPLPSVAVWAGLALGLVNFGLLLPYIRHVFEFLQPNNFITRIKGDAREALERVIETPGDGVEPKMLVVEAIDRIADNCLSAISQTDRGLALHSVRTLEDLLCHYLSLKASLGPTWADIAPEHFLSLSQEFYQEIVAHGTWVEAKALMEFELVLRRALAPMGEVVSQIAASTRHIGEAALEAEDEEAIELIVRFFNTYIRHALNSRDVRALYNIFYQYQLLSVKVMESRPDLCQRIVRYLVYYGQLANEMAMPFVTVTTAHDVRVLCETAFFSPGVDVVPLLDLFLSLDQPGEGRKGEQALIGVRKAQSILGAFFLEHEAEPLAQRIRHDMSHESAQRLLRIRDGILTVSDQKFWEITDRGVNFDYVPPERHPHIRAFFEPMLRDGRRDR